jgi:hypothetical protein
MAASCSSALRAKAAESARQHAVLTRNAWPRRHGAALAARGACSGAKAAASA